ncbi:hypothetical protein FE257_010416 [Aspergillus nanangensis]|uniref:Acetyl-CoA synthetase-like protein n=1 Tax=Aspergillus nanangensis TaxID=2582783 RepID=A0AAD4CKB0_ASPNN|nr:hypothetical protein FE257_010416 [Aspergillus nanangensis]
MPITSPYPDIDIPDVSIWSFLFERPDVPYPRNHGIFYDESTGREYTYNDVRHLSLQFGHGLRQRWQWKKGEVLAIFSPNHVMMAPVIWGCQWAGGVVTTANFSYTAGELARQLKSSKSSAVVSTREFLQTAQNAMHDAGMDSDKIILLDESPLNTIWTFSGFLNYIQLGKASEREQETIKPSEDFALLMYSSGTSGHPKGVRLTHRNIVANILQSHVFSTGKLNWKTDKQVGFLPFFHIYGLVGLLHHPLYDGVPVIVMKAFDLGRLCAAVEKYRATSINVVPPVLLALSKNPTATNYDLSSLRFLHSAAAPLTHELINAVTRRLKVTVLQSYGLTEASPATFAQIWNDPHQKIGSVGMIMPSMTAKIVEVDGHQELPPNEPGELCIKGPNLFSGYYEHPMYDPEHFSQDGFFKTGDIGYMDDDGHLFITDRIKELIKYKGFQVAPAELEGVLQSHCKVADVAVTGVFDQDHGTEFPLAYIVPSPGVAATDYTAQELQDWIKKHLAPHKWLRGGVHWVDQIPKSNAGKILRRVLKDKAKIEWRGRSKL